MSRRYYLSPIIGNGQTLQTAFRAKIADMGVAQAPIIPTVGGRPTFAWTLVLVNTIDHSPLLADAALTPLPDISLDTLLTTLSVPIRNVLSAKLASLGVDGTITASTTLREIIRRIGQHLEPAYSEHVQNVN